MERRTRNIGLLLATFALIVSCAGDDPGGDTRPLAAEEVAISVPATATATLANPDSDVDERSDLDDGVVPEGSIQLTAVGVEADAGASESTPEEPEEPEEPWSSEYAEGIQPILQNTCARCHAAGAAGSQHFALEVAADAVDNAPLIAAYVAAKEMPPWPASDLSVPFRGDTSLTVGQIDAIVAWADGGAVLDVDPQTPITSSVPIFTLEDPELAMTSAGGPYTGDPSKVDDYRCLVFEPEIQEPSWIVGTEFRPDQTQVVHHGIFHVASKELRGQAEFWGDADGQPGWPCYGGTGLHTRDGGYQFRLGGWAPGGSISRQPEGYGIELQPGDFLIIQVHYHYDGSAPADLSEFRIDLADPDVIAEAGGSLKTLSSDVYLTPAELPCYGGDTHRLCDRDAAVQRAKDLYGPIIGDLATRLLENCGQTPDDYADMTDGTSTSVCDVEAQSGGVIEWVAPHMHELGLSYRMTLHPDTPDELVLIDIPDWSFDWQFGFRPIEEIPVDVGDTIRIECSWNRERAPYEAVGWIIWADGTGDEMCYSALTIRPT